jgi:hypothetical protein
MNKTIEALLRGYIVFWVNGGFYARYNDALAAQEAIVNDPVIFDGLHILKGWRRFYYRGPGVYDNERWRPRGEEAMSMTWFGPQAPVLLYWQESEDDCGFATWERYVGYSHWGLFLTDVVPRWWYAPHVGWTR